MSGYAVWILALAAALVGRPMAVWGAEQAAPVDFNRDIRPLLSRHCLGCHGLDEESRQGGLRLDERDAATGLADSGEAAIVPGDPAASQLMVRVASAEDEERMPPAESGPPLSADEQELLRRWIAQGAPYAVHWSFVAPQRPRVPEVQQTAWPTNPIDHFVLAVLESQGLPPNPAADRYELLRRVSLDLRGLPPTRDEIEEFVHDARPDAYERAVDRWLADPAYGERWARVWLDLARYADSRGLGSDPLRDNMWRYRDWVIDALNRNVPYDVFTIEQLAGDLLPGASLEQRIATAFHRNTMTNTEGGTDDEEFRVEAVKDRVDTTLQVWMGLTVGCAKCHDHKYDPLSQREYYQLFAVFNQTADRDLPDESPTLEVPRPEDLAALEAHARRVAELERQLAELDQQLAVQDPSPATAAPQALAEPAAEAPAAEAAAAEAASPPSPEPAAPQPTARDTLAKQLEELRQSRPAVPTLPVMQELSPEQRRATHVLVKGNFLTKGERVEPGVPGSFHPLDPGAVVDRLAVARWLIDPQNPLTARVAVNRVWAQLFGTGLVESEEDWGTQGDPPSHPALLDYLATELIQLRWDMKQLTRLIVLSSTYRQSSAVRADHLARDPRNRFLARGPRVRLEAEMVRDQALALSGLLTRQLGGPSVYPHQPPGLWRAAFNGERTWPTSSGPDRYRRGLYTFWRRTVPYPSLATFDAPSREVCTLRRPRTNTPLQALVTLNDPVYVEAAQALARRIVREGGGDAAARARYGLYLCLCRPPEAPQVAVLQELVSAARAELAADEAAAVQLATDPLGPLPEGSDAIELAAWTVAANVLLNLDAVLNK
jgi:hypothetical protein